MQGPLDQDVRGPLAMKVTPTARGGGDGQAQRHGAPEAPGSNRILSPTISVTVTRQDDTHSDLGAKSKMSSSIRSSTDHCPPAKHGRPVIWGPAAHLTQHRGCRGGDPSPPEGKPGHGTVQVPRTDHRALTAAQPFR